MVDDIITEYIDITRGVPQGTVLGPISFSLMINDIKPVSPSSLFVKFAMISQSVSLFTLRIAI